jgi:hypothetical protein
VRYVDEQVADRSFGLLLTAVLLAVGLRHLRVWALAAAVVMLLVALAMPSVLRGPRRAWMRLGSLLGAIVNPIVLGVLFFFVITPAGLLGRVIGRDPLRLRPVSLRTYWRERADATSDMTLPF